MSGLLEVHVEVVVGEHRTTHGSHSDGLPLDAQLIDCLRNETMGDAVGAPGAVMRDNVCQGLGARIDWDHFTPPPTLSK